MTPRERDIREKQEFHRPYAVGRGLCNGAQEWWDNVEYLLSQLTTAREIIEEAKKALIEGTEGPDGGVFWRENILAKITEMEKEK